MPENFWKKVIPFWLVILIIVIVAIIIFLIFGSRAKIPFLGPSGETINEPEVVSPETSLASGKQIYEIMTDSSRRFKITEVEIDPLDVKQGESQRIRVLVMDLGNKPITSNNKVEGTALTDNKTTPFSFELKEASDANGGTLTKWESSWILEGTCDGIYIISITAKSADEEHKVDITLK